jgi:hypothetical protein
MLLLCLWSSVACSHRTWTGMQTKGATPPRPTIALLRRELPALDAHAGGPVQGVGSLRRRADRGARRQVPCGHARGCVARVPAAQPHYDANEVMYVSKGEGVVILVGCAVEYSATDLFGSASSCSSIRCPRPRASKFAHTSLVHRSASLIQESRPLV